MISNSNIYKNGEHTGCMANQLVNLRISSSLLTRTRKLVKQDGFNNVQDLLKNALRDFVNKRELEQNIIQLKKLYGSQKGKGKIATKEELDEHIRKVYMP
jgi:Arc/MetJ-type ribon-helix-helix transcriptional regulator